MAQERVRLSPYDAAEHLTSEEDVWLYLQAAVEEAGDDRALIADVLGDIARSGRLPQRA